MKLFFLSRLIFIFSISFRAISFWVTSLWKILNYFFINRQAEKQNLSCDNKNREYKIYQYQENEIQEYQIQIIRLGNIERKTHELINFQYELGHSIAALNIQLQATQKLWHSDPSQAEKYLSEACNISSYMMKEIRTNIKLMGKDNYDSLTTCR